MIEILAISPSGEVVFVKDKLDRVWEQRRISNSPARLVGIADVDRAVVDYGYSRVGQSVRSWAQLPEVLERLIQRPPASELPINETIAHAMLPVMRDWLRSPTDRANISLLVSRLLRCRQVAENDHLRNQLIDLQIESAEPLAVPDRGRTERFDHVNEYFAVAA